MLDLSPIMIATDGWDFITYLPREAPYPPDSAHTQAPGTHARWLSVLGKHHGSRGLGKRQH
jgi:hypothetical protein